MKTYEERTQAVMDGVARKKKTRRMAVALSTTASLCLVVLVLSLVLFLPYGTTEIDINSPYYAVIQRLEQSRSATAYRNNYEKWSDEIGSWRITKSSNMLTMDEANSAVEEAGNAVPKGNSQEYIENTNNQVEGVREGDLLKQSTDYWYYLHTVDVKVEGQWTPEEGDQYYYDYYYTEFYTDDGDVYYNPVLVRYRLQLSVYDKKGKDTQCITTFDFAPNNGYIKGYSTKEMFLSDDCNTLTVLVDGVYHDSKPLTAVLTLDISDLQNINVVKQQYVSGEYITSRVCDGRLLVITSYYNFYNYYYDAIDYEKPETFVPYVLDGKSKDAVDNYHPVDPDDILIPETGGAWQYTVATLFDGGQSVGQYALLGGSNCVYVNQQRAYISALTSDHSRQFSNVLCLSYGAEGLRKVGYFLVEGSILNQYSMDEYNGVFRVATSLMQYQWVEDDDYSYMVDSTAGAALYCYSVDDWKLIAKVEDFAPKNETVRSARFMGNTAYICTAVYVRDPVFCFDLSDYSHITYTQTPEITGFSMSLTEFVDGTLLGIGVDDRWNAKIELYRATQEDVTTLSKVELNNTSLCEEYKSYLFDRTDGLIAVPAWCWDNEDGYQDSGSMYYVMAYRNGLLGLVKSVSIQNSQLYDARCAVADGYMYMFCGGWYTVCDLQEMLTVTAE